MIGFIILFALVASVESRAVNATGRNAAGSCFQLGCAAGQCCSVHGYCGTTAEHCANSYVGVAGGNGNCQATGCGAGLCCSRFGYCGNTAEHCGTGQVGQTGHGNCQATGCPAGQCCSSAGFCGVTAAHCGTGVGVGVGVGNVGNGNCQVTGCGAGLCCSRFGYCGNTADHCAGASGGVWINGAWVNCGGCYGGQCINQTCIYGQCTDNKCICNPGIKGKSCNMDIIDCDRNSCTNNGTCIELMNGFACQCLPDFDGSRCQYRRTINDNHCKIQCVNNGKCIVINNREKCLCPTKYYGRKCEYIRKNTSLPSIRRCSVLKFRNNHNEGKCLAIGLTPSFDVYCQCQYDNQDKHLVNCHITPTPYSTQKCSFKKALSSATLSTLLNSISIYVCPVNWQILDQYENNQDIINNVHITQCQLI